LASWDQELISMLKLHKFSKDNQAALINSNKTRIAIAKE